MDLLVKMSEFAARIAKEELALHPDREPKDVREKQRAIHRNVSEIVVHDEAAPRRKEMQLLHEPEPEREKNQGGDEDGVG